MTITYRANSLGIIGNLYAIDREEKLAKTYHRRRRQKKVLPWFSPAVKERLAGAQRSQAFLNTFFGTRTIRPFWPKNRNRRLTATS